MKDIRERLRDAIIEGQSVIVKRILRRFPNHLQNVDPTNGWSSLHYAGYYGHYIICVHLVSLGHDKFEISLNFENNSPLHTTVLSGNHQTLLMILQSFPQCINMKGDRLRCPLHIAAMMNYNNCVDLLIDKGANVNVVDADGNTPLHLAMMYASKESIHSLLKNDAYFDIRNIDGWLPVEISKDVHTREWFNTIKKEIMLDKSLKLKQNNTSCNNINNANANLEFRQPISNKGISSTPSSPNSSSNSFNNDSLSLGPPDPSFDLKNILSPTFPDSIPPAKDNPSQLRQRSFSFNKKAPRPYQKSIFIDTSMNSGNSFTNTTHALTPTSNSNNSTLNNISSSTPNSNNVEKLVIRSTPNTPISINTPTLKSSFGKSNNRLHSNSLDSTASSNIETSRIIETPPSENRHRSNTSNASIMLTHSHSYTNNTISVGNTNATNQLDLYASGSPVTPTSPISQVIIKPTGKAQQLINNLNSSSSKNLQNMINGRYRSNTVMSYNSIISGESLDTNYSTGNSNNNNIIESKNSSSPYIPISSQINFTSMKQRNESPVKKQNSIKSGTSLKSISSSKNMSYKSLASIATSLNKPNDTIDSTKPASSPFKINDTNINRHSLGNFSEGNYNHDTSDEDNDSGTDINSSDDEDYHND